MQTLNGYRVANDAQSYTPDVGAWRRAIGNWNFTDDTGAQGVYTIFTVTGNVYLYGIFGVCNELLDSGGAATISLGIAGSAVSLIRPPWQPSSTRARPGKITPARPTRRRSSFWPTRS